MPYLNVNQVESELSAAAGPPNQLITELITLPHPTWEGRTCRAIKIANGSGLRRIGVCFIGGLHAREWGSPDILIFFVQQLIRAFLANTGITLGGKSFTATQIRSIVNGLDTFVFPQVNPDGRNYSMTVDPMWRKNQRPGPSGNPTCLGVDINRNFEFLWNYPAYFSPSAPITNSQDPCNPDVYIGPSAASEPETKNVVSMLDNHPNIRFFVDLHSYTEKILYNWGDDQNQSTDSNMNFRNPAFNGQRGIANDAAYREHIDSSDQTLAINLAQRMRDSIQAARGRTYTVDTFFSLYPTAGTSTDYAFSRHFADPSKEKVHSFTIEWGQEFQPPYTEMQNIIQEVTAGLLEFSVGIVEAVGYPTEPRVSIAPQVQYLANRTYTVRAVDPYTSVDVPGTVAVYNPYNPNQPVASRTVRTNQPFTIAFVKPAWTANPPQVPVIRVTPDDKSKYKTASRLVGQGGLLPRAEDLALELQAPPRKAPALE